MSTARATLAAENRDIIGKKVAQLRRAGRLPAVVYGHGVDSTSISVDAHDFEQLRRHSGPNALVDLSVDGGEAEPGPRVCGPGPSGQPADPACRPLPGPDDRGADGRRPARGDRHLAGRRAPGRHAPPPDRIRAHPRAPGPPPAVDRVLGRVARRLRHHDPRSRPVGPERRDAADRRRRDHRQGPGTARRGSRGSPAEAGEGAPEGEEAAEGAAAEGETAATDSDEG